MTQAPSLGGFLTRTPSAKWQCSCRVWWQPTASALGPPGRQQAASSRERCPGSTKGPLEGASRVYASGMTKDQLLHLILHVLLRSLHSKSELMGQIQTQSSELPCTWVLG